MVKHIILWKLKDNCGDKNLICRNAKAALEALNGKIDGLISLKVNTEKLASSNADMMLDCTLTSEEALKGYQKNPLHAAAADEFVRPFTETRLCLDFEE